MSASRLDGTQSGSLATVGMALPERAILVGVHRREADSPDMQELARLTESAGAVVASTMIQRRSSPDPATYIGLGKVEEVQTLCAEQQADLVILGAELAPAQQRNLERHLKVKVVDRTALVLDIFARRARTREGRLQVELAQVTYLLPRLAGRGVWLSRLGGGIGTRGPGETKLEVDRRRIRRRITDLNRKIDEISRHRSLQRRARRQALFPVVALVGYTNAGKSTLLNALTNAGVFVEDKLFATLDPTVRKVTLPNRRQILLADTVGFITNLPTQLIAAFRATLEEVTEADLLVHVVDASHPQWRDQMAAVDTVLEELGAAEKPVVHAVNKIDLIPQRQASEVLREVGEGVALSALHGVGLLNLLRHVAEHLPQRLVRVKLVVPYSRAKALPEIFSYGRVLRQEYGERGVSIEAELPSVEAKRLKALVRGA